MHNYKCNVLLSDNTTVEIEIPQSTLIEVFEKYLFDCACEDIRSYIDEHNISLPPKMIEFFARKYLRVKEEITSPDEIIHTLIEIYPGFIV